MFRWGRWMLAGCLLASVGCGGSNYPVTGHVTFKDGRDVKVLSGGTVALESTDESKPVSCRGTIRDDGSFSIGMLTETDGAPLGNYIVLVTPRSFVRASQQPKNWPPLNPKYGRTNETTLRFEVEAKSNVLELTVD